MMINKVVKNTKFFLETVRLKKKLIINLIGLVIILSLSFQINQARSLSMHFGDEEEHMASAYYMNNGYQLHKDIQGNHQPVVYFASAIMQKNLNPPNIFMLIKRHRQMMFFYGAVWSFILVLRFKQVGLFFVLFFEFLKYFLFGNLNLMESWAVYPAVYLLAGLIEVLFENEKIKSFDLFFMGLCSFLVIFNMVPMWPWLIIIWILYLIKVKKKLWLMISGVLVGMIILFNFVYPYSIIDWFRETIWNNFFYAVPQLNPFKSKWDWLKIPVFPFLAFFTKGSLQAKFIALFISGWLMALIWSIYKKDKKWRYFAFLYIFLIMANNRVLSPGSVYYHGFHMLPFIGLLIWVFVYSLRYLFSVKDLKKYLLPLFLFWSLVLLVNKNMPYFQLNTDINHEYYVNYSTLDDMNFAIKNLVNPGDRLAVTANESLLYWESGAELPTRQVVYGGWEPSVKELNDKYNQVFFGENPPEIIFGGDEPQLLKDKYISIQRHEKPTELFIRMDKLIKITDKQWQALASRDFNQKEQLDNFQQ